MNKYITILNGGSLAGALSFILFLTIYHVLGMNPFGGMKFLGLVFPAVIMYFSLKKYREIEGEGFLKYGQGLLVGIIFTFVYASLSAMLIYLYGVFVDDGFLEMFVTENLEALGETKEQLIAFLGEGTYEEMITEFQQFTVGRLALSDFQSKTMGSFLIALIIAAILRKNPPTFEDSNE